jgi:hypothetical protein
MTPQPCQSPDLSWLEEEWRFVEELGLKILVLIDEKQVN